MIKIYIYSQLKTVTFIPLLLENHVTELTLTLESQEARYFSKSHDSINQYFVLNRRITELEEELGEVIMEDTFYNLRKTKY